MRVIGPPGFKKRRQGGEMIDAEAEPCIVPIPPAAPPRRKQQAIGALARSWGGSFARSIGLVFLCVLFVFLSNLIVCIWVITRHYA